MATARYI